MPKVTQFYTLFKFLENGQPKTVDEIKDLLGVHYYSVAIYISEMKRVYKAEIESIRDGRRVTAYKLTNASDIDVPMYRTNNAIYVKKEKIKQDQPNNVESQSKESEELHVEFNEDSELRGFDDRELLDTYSSLGIWSEAGHDL